MNDDLEQPPNLPDLDESNKADVVIYDGDCNFCRGQVTKLHQLDIGKKRLCFVSLHDPRVAGRYPELTHDMLMKEIHVIDLKNRIRAGARAIRYLSRRLPTLWILAPLLHIPFSLPILNWGYNQVAKRRYRIAGQSCESNRCKIR